MALEVVEDGLPALLLLFDGMRLLGIEGHAHINASRSFGKFDLRRALAEGILDQLVCFDFGVGSGEIEAETAVFRLHAGRKLATFAQIHAGSGRVPVIRGSIPLGNVRRCRVGVPDALDRSCDGGFNVDFQDGLLWWLSVC